MKRNIFWTVWGIVGLVLFLVSGMKSFAIEVRQQLDASTHKYVPALSQSATKTCSD